MGGECHEEIADYWSFAWRGRRGRSWLAAGARRRLCGRAGHGRRAKLTVSTERSKRRLQHYIGRKLNQFTAKSISTVTTHCIRNACESSAIVCRH